MTINKNLKNVASILLATFLFVNSYSQEAENIYQNKFSKLSFVIQPSFISGMYSTNFNRSNYPSIDFKDSGSTQFGFYYNFSQKNNFNFKTGIIVKEFNPLFNLNVSNEDIGYGLNYDLSGYNPVNAFIFSIPIKTEYYFKLNNKLNLVMGSGLNLNLFTGGGEITSHINVETNTEGRRIFTAITNQEQISFSGELSIGLNYKTNFALFQLEAFYNKNLLNYPATGRYSIYDLEINDDVNGDFSIDGNFYGLSLNISPKKGWLKSKKKK